MRITFRVLHKLVCEGIESFLCFFSVAAGSSGDLGIAARCLACIADVLGCLAGEGKGGLRSGPAANPLWAAAFKLLEDANLPAGVQELAEQRNRWISRSKLHPKMKIIHSPSCDYFPF